MDNSSTTSNTLLDQLAVLLSGLCLAHCLLLPLVVAVLPFLAHVSVDHLHLQMLAFVLPISVVALTLGYRRHNKRDVLAWGAFGMLLLVVGATVVHSRYGLIADRLFTVTGALLLAVVHYKNNRLARHNKI